jgi:hypothetical protein
MQGIYPTVQHRGAVIIAACHPSPDDQDANIKKVQWDVVTMPGSIVEHCIVSLPVSLPKKGLDTHKFYSHFESQMILRLLGYTKRYELATMSTNEEYRGSPLANPIAAWN